jgi:hypothetical protein
VKQGGFSFTLSDVNASSDRGTLYDVLPYSTGCNYGKMVVIAEHRKLDVFFSIMQTGRISCLFIK